LEVNPPEQKIGQQSWNKELTGMWNRQAMKSRMRWLSVVRRQQELAWKHWGRRQSINFKNRIVRNPQIQIPHRLHHHHL